METKKRLTDQSITQINIPRLIGAIIEEMLRSNSPLAKGYRKFLASKENIAEKGDNKHE